MKSTSRDLSTGSIAALSPYGHFNGSSDIFEADSKVYMAAIGAPRWGP